LALLRILFVASSNFGRESSYSDKRFVFLLSSSLETEQYLKLSHYYLHIFTVSSSITIVSFDTT